MNKIFELIQVMFGPSAGNQRFILLASDVCNPGGALVFHFLDVAKFEEQHFKKAKNIWILGAFVQL